MPTKPLAAPNNMTWKDSASIPCCMFMLICRQPRATNMQSPRGSQREGRFLQSLHLIWHRLWSKWPILLEHPNSIHPILKSLELSMRKPAHRKNVCTSCCGGGGRRGCGKGPAIAGAAWAGSNGMLSAEDRSRLGAEAELLSSSCLARSRFAWTVAIRPCFYLYSNACSPF